MSLARSESRMIRGRILKILEIDYPHFVSDRVINLTLNDVKLSAPPAVIGGHLQYLMEKGYVEVSPVVSSELGLSMNMARLTAKGKDLLEGSIEPDVGVYLE